jgi:UDP-N-acetylmuramoyl-L-alanyl-D-glutamate--2,6-diaminopimelate ligase
MLNKLKKIYHFILAVVAYWFYGRPSRKMIMIGVTGTKGKSTTCRLIASALGTRGDKVGMLTTVEWQIGDKVMKNNKKITMLGRGLIQKMLRKMSHQGCYYAVVEISSQGILQFRHYGLDLDIVVFTNLAPEHIEAHGGFENYKKSKAVIFQELKKQKNKIINEQEIKKIILVNIDDSNAEYYLNFPADKKITFGIKNNEANVRGVVHSTNKLQTVFLVDNHEFILPMAGEFNIYNALPAVVLAREFGLTDEKIAQSFKQVKQIDGRMEFIEAEQPFNVIVDFAHETLSYVELFKAIRKFTTGKIIALIGSDGGGRDKQKRSKMGQIAGELCDVVIVTEVNCYDENSADIIATVASGARVAGKCDGENLFLEENRRQAIILAFGLAKADDTVVLVGKGGESGIIQAHGKKIPWDDREVAREELLKMKF